MFLIIHHQLSHLFNNVLIEIVIGILVDHSFDVKMEFGWRLEWNGVGGVHAGDGDVY